MLIAFIFGCNDTNNSFNEILKSNDLQKIELKRKEIIVNQQKIFDQLNLIDNKIVEQIITLWLKQFFCKKKSLIIM